MNADAELIVIGAGPAGAEAAIGAVEAGVDTLLVDENSAAGGQVYRAAPASFAAGREHAEDPDKRAGRILRDRLTAAGVRVAFRHQVWSVAPGFRVDAVGPEGPVCWRAPRLLVATGTAERVTPFPGWTLPGVIGLAAATVGLKSQYVVPGERTVVAGCGPLLAAVAAGIVKAGGDVAAVVDLGRPADWLRTLPAMVRRPDLAWRGARWVAGLRRHGVPLVSGHAIRDIKAEAGKLRVTTVPVDAAGRSKPDKTGPEFTGDAVAVGHGLVPTTEITRLLGADHVFDTASGGWIPERDALCRTSVPGLMAAGDGAGISGAAAAVYEGRLAGLAAAHDLGRLSPQPFRRDARELTKKLRHAGRFGRAMARVMALKPGQVESIPPETIVCRCEDVTREEIDAAVRDGARDVNQLKAWTRCGMGPCQGRTCGDVVGALVAQQLGDREKAGLWTVRVPLRPVPLDLLTGEYGYGDIPIPKAAPL